MRKWRVSFSPKAGHGHWKKQALESLPEVFVGKRDRSRDEEAALRDWLYQQIGQLQVELEWLKKRLAIPPEVRRGMVDPIHGKITIKRPRHRRGWD